MRVVTSLIHKAIGQVPNSRYFILNLPMILYHFYVQGLCLEVFIFVSIVVLEVLPLYSKTSPNKGFSWIHLRLIISITCPRALLHLLSLANWELLYQRKKFLILFWASLRESQTQKRRSPSSLLIHESSRRICP